MASIEEDLEGSLWVKGATVFVALKLRAAEQACERADQDGWTELSAGVYLHSRGSITADQAQWKEENSAKRVDFSQAPYWLTKASRLEPVAIFGAMDRNLLWAVPADERAIEIHEKRQKLQCVAALHQRPEAELASAQQVQAKRQAYGRAM